MEKKKVILAAWIAATAVWSATAQTITGSVFDSATGESIMGATVKYGDAKGVITDVDGHFSIDVNKLPVKLAISYMGYHKQEITVYDDEEEINVKLSEVLNVMNDVVVVGYGTQKRTQLTGSVITVKSDVFEKLAAPTLDVALGGQVAGLNVTAASGQPGAESSIRIRGGNSVNASNEPLYVIDGFIYFKDASYSGTGLGAIESSLNPLATINPNDIESIEVLKDVSATAIYGSRGANGVIIITTKKGEKGAKNAQLTYGYSVGVSNVSKKLDLMNASEWAQFQKTYFSNKGGYTDAEIAALGKGTDWQDAVLRTALQQTHELSVSGATDKSRYAFSANYTDQKGIILNSGFQRYNFHTNVEWEVRKGLNFGVNATFGRSKQAGLTTSQSQKFNSSPFSAGITNSFVYALLMPPVINVYKDNGDYNFYNPYEYGYFAIEDHMANPVYDLEESVAENINNYLLSNVWATYRIGHLILKAAVGMNSEKLTQNYFSGAYTILGMAVKGIGGIGNRQTEIWQQEYTATWDKDLNDNNHLDFLVGYTKQNTATTYSSISTNHYTNESRKQYNLGDGADIYIPQTGYSDSYLHSLIGRINYSLLDRYNLTATYRRDYSSRFAPGHRWGKFPSLGLSWNADKEAFLANVATIDYLKLRASAGLVGNQEIPDYIFDDIMDANSYGGSSSYVKTNEGNKTLTWESTASYNVGIDLGLYKSRVNLVADVYLKKTYDLLLDVPIGFASGVSSQYQNVGNVVNKGIELSIDGTILNRRRLKWSASANIAHNINEITDMGTTNDIPQGADKQQILRVGEPLGAFYGLRFIGIVQSDEDVTKLPTVLGQQPKPGDLKYEDTNGDNRITDKDRQILGSTQPDLTFGFSTSVKYRQFDFSANVAGSHGNRLYNALGRRLEQTGDSYNVLRTVLKSWTAEEGGNTLALANTTRPFNLIDSRYVQDASYLKLKNVTLGYSPRLPKNSAIGSIRIYITGSNLLTITPYKGYDPEVSSGTDSGAYPSARSFTLGATVTL